MLQLQDLDVYGKRVLVRVDVNVPLVQREITDDTRIRAIMPTVQYIQSHGGIAILLSHLGRPRGIEPALSLGCCARRLEQLLGSPVAFLNDCQGDRVRDAIASLPPGSVVMLENLRFYPEEEQPTALFVQALAALGDCYVNDAFGTAHRAHASTTLLASCFPRKAAAGFLLNKELQALRRFVEPTQRPFVAIIGGAKISTKLGVLHALLRKADTVLIGGAMAYTFLRAQGIPTGDSPVEESMVAEARSLLQATNIQLPVDFVAAAACRAEADSRIVTDGFPQGYQGVDIGPQTLAAWRPILSAAKMIFWNGPVGFFECPPFSRGTHELASIIAQCKEAFSAVGGGDSIAALEQAGMKDAVSYVSTGGGASLEYIEQGTLPGVQALEEACT